MALKTSLFNAKQGSNETMPCLAEMVAYGHVNVAIDWSNFPSDYVTVGVTGIFTPITSGTDFVCTVRVRIGGTGTNSDDPVGTVVFEKDITEQTSIHELGTAILKPAGVTASYIKLTVERKSGGTGIDDQIQIDNAVVTLKPTGTFLRDQGLLLTDRTQHDVTTWGAVVAQWTMDFDSIDSTELIFAIAARVYAVVDFDFGYGQVVYGGEYGSPLYDELIVGFDISTYGVESINRNSSWITKPTGQKLIKVILYTANSKPAYVKDLSILIVEGGSTPPPPEF